VPELLLVAHAGLRAQAEPTSSVADRRATEDGRLEDDAPGRIGHLGRCAAHDARQADRALPVGDDEHPLVQAPLDVVDRLQRLAGTRPTHDDLSGGDRIRVVGMLWLSELVHHVVRDVHHRADRAHSRRDEPALHPVRRRPVVDVIEPQRGEARAEPGLLDPHADPIGNPVIRLGPSRVGRPQLGAGEGRDLAGQPHHAEGVPAVRLHVDIEHDLTDRLGQRLAQPQLIAVAEDVDPLGVGSEPELDRAA
jgi:hypothetical protein